jgi:hypothetical protein
MTESEWRATADPFAMFKFVGRGLSERKRRLFVCACGRRWWDALPGVGRDALAQAEALADGASSEAEVEQVKMAVNQEILWLTGDENPAFPTDSILDRLRAVRRALDSLWPDEMRVFLATFLNISVTHAGRLRANRPDDPGATYAAEAAATAGLLAEVVGDPFRPVRIEPGWRTADVIGLARAAYEDRAFDRLPILADALTDAGCDDESILTHCRSAGPHVRGCWVVDLLSGRE